jgi:hypothetical protein
MNQRRLVGLLLATLVAGVVQLTPTPAASSVTCDTDSCSAGDEHCIVKQVYMSPVICPPNGYCTFGGEVCRPGFTCNYVLTGWDCGCWKEGGPWGDNCPHGS